MDEDSIGFFAKAPVSAWNKRIGVDTPGLFRAALKGALAFFSQNALGAISAAIDATAAFKLRPLPPVELAWLLIQRALARAMAELTVEAAQRQGAYLKDDDGLVAALDHALDGAEVWIDPVFFDRPAEHSVVGAVKPQFHDWLVSFGLNDAEAESVNHRLGAYFTFALRREWAKHAETYHPLEAEFQKYENRFASADARERAWIRNADYLQRLIREPVFEQEAFGLEQVYVPLRAWYLEPPVDSQGHGFEEEIDKKERRIVVDLEQHLDTWFEGADPKDAVRAICGGPGSGKTSVAKMWSARLARASHRILFVPLHQLVLRKEHPDVQELLWQFLSEGDVLPDDPLDKNGESRLLIAFDGLDELAMQGQAGRDLASNFVDEVVARLRIWNGRDGRLVQVLLGGRDIAVEATRLSGQQLLHVLPYHGRRPDECEDPDNLLANSAYGCDVWWRKLGQAIGESYDGLPPALAGEQLAEITAQPLLNYLLALRYRKGGLETRTSSNLNLLYGDLLDDVYDRRWGAGPHATANVLQKRDFHALLDELGLAAWYGAGRAVSESAVEHACNRAGLGEPLARLKDAARQGAISLLAAFYFRQAGHIPGGERTFEFTHKSFGEYLAARRLMRVVRETDDDRADKEKRDRMWSKEDALVSWCRTTGLASLDEDLLAFLLRQAELERENPDGSTVVKKWQQSFAELLSYQLHNGLPMQALSLASFHEMTRHARNAEEALLAAHFCCASAVGESSSIRWPGPFALRDLVTRLEQGTTRALVRRCLGWLGTVRTRSAHFLIYTNLDRANLESGNFERANLAGVDLTNANLAGANLTGATLTGASRKELADLAGANLTDANLTDAALTKADLRGANLTRAKLERATLREVDLRGANLTGANLSEADLSGAGLLEADLTEAKLFGAKLEGARLGSANLTKVVLKDMNLERHVLKSAILTEADLSGAVLSHANLVETNLNEAKLARAILNHAILGGASLERAKLNEANLEGALLGDANLTGADLTGAKLNKAILIRTILERAILVGADLSGANLSQADFKEADLVGAGGLDEARGLSEIRSFEGAKIERKWVERLGLDAEKLGLILVDDVDPE